MCSPQLTLTQARGIATSLIRDHLGSRWSFGFDHAKRRAGACNYTKQRISVSRYFVKQASREELRQVLLHEIAHALVGPNAGHGPAWKRAAASIGYQGGRTFERQFAEHLAPWRGICPQGHLFHRFRAPSRTSSCSLCSPRFDRKYVIEWSRVSTEQ